MDWFWRVFFGFGMAVVAVVLLALWFSRHNKAHVAAPLTGECDELAEGGGYERCPEPAVEHLGGRDRCARHAELYRYYG